MKKNQEIWTPWSQLVCPQVSEIYVMILKRPNRVMVVDNSIGPIQTRGMGKMRFAEYAG